MSWFRRTAGDGVRAAVAGLAVWAAAVGCLGDDASHARDAASQGGRGDSSVEASGGAPVDASDDRSQDGPASGGIGGGSGSGQGGADAADDGSVDAGGGPLWARAWGTAGPQSLFSMAVDAAGNAFLTGDSTDPVDFGGGLLPCTTPRPLYLTKIDTSGSLAWAKCAGFMASGKAVAVDDDGSIALAGDFHRDLDLGMGLVPYENGFDVFVAKLDANGDPLWQRGFGGVNESMGPPIDQIAGDVAFDANGAVIATGVFKGPIDFGDGINDAGAGWGIFVVKLDGATGATVWSRTYLNTPAGMGGPPLGRLAVDPSSSDIVVGGHFLGSLDTFPPSPVLASNGLRDAYVLKIRADGQGSWKRSFGGDVDDRAEGVAIDASGQVLLTGTYRGGVDFGGRLLSSAQGTADIFVATYGPNGTLADVVGYDSDGSQSARDLRVADDATLVFGGTHTGFDFGSQVLPSNGEDGLVARAGPDAAPAWARCFGDDAAKQAVNRVGVDASGNVYAAGLFDGRMTVGSDVLESLGLDIFLVKLAP